MDKNLTEKTDSSLKSKSMNRLIYDMIMEIKDSAGQKNLIMMIVDPYTMKVLATFLTISELFSKGIVSIENLHIGRKKFPNYHSIYFISPNEKSVECVLRDFTDGETPQYSRAHFFFCHKISDNLLEKLISSNSLAKRIKTCKEINISYFLRDKNLFDLGMPNALEIFTQINDKKELSSIGEIMLENMAERIFTACVTMKEYPYIQYAKQSILGSKLAKILNRLFKDFYGSKVFNDKRGILLLLDRQIDATTPFLHDYTYESIVYDFYDVQENVLNFKNKKNKLDDKDEVWTKYKNKVMGQVLNGLQSDFQEFMSSDLSKKQREKTDEISFDKMAELLHGQKEFKEKSRQFVLHMNLASDIMEKYQERCIYDLIELEQDIITGLSTKGETRKNKEILSDFAKMMNRITEDEKVRLMLSLHTCIDITEKDFNVISDKIDPNRKRAIYNLEWLGIFIF
jgi:hypothetical protein